MHTALIGITSRTLVMHQERDTHTLACDLQLCKTKSAMPTALIVITSLTVVMHAPGTGHSLGSSPLACDLQLCKTNSAVYTALIVFTWKRHTAWDLHPCM